MAKKKDAKSIQPEVKKSYYIPDLLDFRLGTVYLQRWSGTNGWRESILDEACYDMSIGHCEFMSIVSQVKWTRGEFYRIKFLDVEDVEMLGFVRCDDGRLVNSNCTVLLDWTCKNNVKIYIDDEIIFNGKLLNMYELKQVLCYLGIFNDVSRDSKFKQYGDTI